MTYHPYAPQPAPAPRRGKARWILAVIAGAVLGLCAFGGIMSLVPIDDDSSARGLAIVEPSPTADPDASRAAGAKTSPSPAPAPKVKVPPVVIGADMLVHVGEDVPAGTYRVTVNVDGDCYWKKSRDAEGQDIIANDIVAGGRPQVTLKKGQWFTSARCGEWHKR